MEYQERWVEVGGSGLTEIAGDSGWERVFISSSSQMGAELNAVGILGQDNVDVFGNDMGNHVLGNSGANRIEGAAGNDRLIGMHGDDVLLGGEGDDSLFGGFGNDTLIGGAGNDELIGGLGADTFVATAGQNIVRDFVLAEGDEFIFNSDMTSSFASAFDAFLDGTYVGSAFDFDTVQVDGLDSIEISSMNGEALTLLGVHWDDFL